MEYIFVGGKPPSGNNVDYTLASVNVSKNLLISLIDVLNTPYFRPDKINTYFQTSISETIKRYTNPLNAKLFLDSGGYSIIVGDVAWECTRSFIDGYIYALQNHYDKFDRVFSLDIPIFLSSPMRNNKTDIELLNKESLSRSLELIKNNPKLKDAFYFIWQFKIMEQYEVWHKLFHELDINPHIKNWALGGMVGLRGITQIDFSPFIGMMYRGLFDYIKCPREDKFSLHSLGVYIRHDRFFISFIEKLFNRYLNREDTYFTYDSVNYMRTAQYKVKDMPISYFDGEKMHVFQHCQTPEEVLKTVYFNDDLFNGVKTEIENVKNSKKLNNVDAFTPLNVFSNLQIDQFFTHVIDKYNMIDLFLNAGKNPTPLKTLLDYHLVQKYPNVFTPRLISSMKANFRWLWRFHYWFVNHRTEETFDPLIREFIRAIQFPAKLDEFPVNNAIDLTESTNSLRHLSLKCHTTFQNVEVAKPQAVQTPEIPKSIKEPKPKIEKPKVQKPKKEPKPKIEKPKKEPKPQPIKVELKDPLGAMKDLIARSLK